MGSNDGHEPHPLRVFFIPFFATGHMIPMVDIALQQCHRARHSLQCRTHLRHHRRRCREWPSYPHSSLPLPLRRGRPPSQCGEHRLVPLADAPKIDAASLLTVGDHERLLRLHHPDAIVSDTHFYWATSIARDLRIPRIGFHAIGLFPDYVLSSLIRHLLHLSVGDLRPFTVCQASLTGLDGPPEFGLPPLRKHRHHPSHVHPHRGRKAYLGVVVNGLFEMESAYSDYYYKIDNMRTRFVVHGANCRPAESCPRWHRWAARKAMANRNAVHESGGRRSEGEVGECTHARELVLLLSGLEMRRYLKFGSQ
ncbi:hypothetical protein J5N97_015531 [Dioscorea zingiberensis]|uniref:Uncharacterized protein n=1 Tax=Dioscorea zingiberensis TaxID=325984 RepID=A0A9D5HL92_9LILI|nr:hypothetical protein J5N97_015531 [Dioscorea zingiberensis]